MTTAASLRSNFMSALASPASGPNRRASAPELLSPESSAQESPVDGFTFEMSDLMLPATAFESEVFGVPQDSGATVVSTTSSYHESPPQSPRSTSPATAECVKSDPAALPRSRKQRKAPASERRHSLPSTLLLSSSTGEAVTQPVPEFLCHLHSMLRDPSYSDLISWQVPARDEPDHMGGGIRGIGKIVVHKPESLQDHVLGRYYRHSKYASFQRQLNYFGFKKRLHGGKKGKLSPCSYIHEGLTDDAGSLFQLKRRPPAKKRASMEMENEQSNNDNDCAASVSTHDSSDSSKKRRVTVEKKSKKNSSNSKKDSSKKEKKDKKSNKSSANKKKVVFTSMPLQVLAEEYGAPSIQSSSVAPLVPNTKASTTPAQPLLQPRAQPMPAPSATTSATIQQSAKPVALPAAQPTLLELLSTTLPPSDVLFNDNIDEDNMMDDEGIPTWVTDDGQYHYHNVDSSLVDLAMLY